MKKSIIILSIVIVITIILTMISNMKKDENNEKKLEKYLEKSGYVLNEQESVDFKTGKNNLDSYLDDYSNEKNSEYSELFYDIDGNSLVKVVMKYDDEVETVFKAEKKLDKDVVTYNYEISMLSSSVMLNGKYEVGDTAFDPNNLTCDVSYTVRMDEEEKDTYCNISKFELLSFLEDINNFTDNQEIKEIIDKGPIHK